MSHNQPSRPVGHEYSHRPAGNPSPFKICDLAQPGCQSRCDTAKNPINCYEKCMSNQDCVPCSRFSCNK
jgi:hypothetical protein